MYISVVQRVKNLRHAKGFLSFFLANCLHCQWRGKRVQREVKKCVSVFTWVYVCVCLSFKYFNFVSNSLRAAAAATTTLMIVSQPCWHFNFTLCFISTFFYTHTCMYVVYVYVFILCSSLLYCFCLLCCSAFNCDCCSGVHCLTFVYLFAHLIASHMLLPLLYASLTPLPTSLTPFCYLPFISFNFSLNSAFSFFPSVPISFRFCFF